MVEFSKSLSNNKTILLILFISLITLYIIYGKYNIREGNANDAAKMINESKARIKRLLNN